MILTGKEIKREYEEGNISIFPFDEIMLNPNSYNYRLSEDLKIFEPVENNGSRFKSTKIQSEGFVLRPGQMYLGSTFESIGSSRYAMSLIGRSSLGRLGLFLQLSANLGHTTSNHCWTLELMATRAIRIYPNMKIGQISFWSCDGEIEKYDGIYGKMNMPFESLVAQ